MTFIDLEYPLFGYLTVDEKQRECYLSLVVVVEAERGKGHLRRLLERLMKEYDIVKIPNVVHPAIIHLAKEFGFVRTEEYAPEFEEYVEILLWRKEGGED